MSTSRSVLRIGNELAVASSSKHARRYLASKAGTATDSTAPSAQTQSPAITTVYASLLLSRPPLITLTPTELESTYYTYTSSVQHALSNPPSQTNAFYFKSGSLPLRRFQTSQHQYLTDTYGSKLAGAAPDIGDVPSENPVQAFERDHWEKLDSKRGETSLERFPDQEVFCLGNTQAGKWEVPKVQMKQGESLDDAVGRIRGIGGMMDGEHMDSWLVTRKPIGSMKDGQNTVSAYGLRIAHLKVRTYMCQTLMI